MRSAYLILFAALFTLSSCEWGKPPVAGADVFEDTLAYKYETIKAHAPDCGNKPDSTCTHVSIKYAEFEGQAKLNDTIAAKLLVMFAGEKPDSSLNALARSFINMYESTKQYMPSRDMFYVLDSYAKVLLQDSSLVTLEAGGYSFQGGAHGATFTGYINWDVKASKEIKLSDILVEGYEAPLNKAGEAIFRKDEKLTPTASLANDYFFRDNKFWLNDNFLVTPLGLKFLYNQYEIKPYAAGQTELLVPYAQIKQLIRPNSVVSHYVK